MNLEKLKEFLEMYPKQDRISVLYELYEMGEIEQREYSVQELAYLTGYTREYMSNYIKSILNKLKPYLEGAYYE